MHCLKKNGNARCKPCPTAILIELLSSQAWLGVVVADCHPGHFNIVIICILLQNFDNESKILWLQATGTLFMSSSAGTDQPTFSSQE